MLDPNPCADCGIDTAPMDRLERADEGTWEWYMVVPRIWGEHGVSLGYLCLGCLEARMGRKLVREDFSDFPISEYDPVYTDRLLDRLGHDRLSTQNV